MASPNQTASAAAPAARPRLPVPTLFALTILGAVSGLPFDLGNATLQSWLADAAPGLSIADIGVYSLVGLPYVLKPLWAPLLDRFTPPPPFGRLGRRRGWMAIAQLFCAFALVLMALTDAEASPVLLGGWALMLSFASASQDIVVDAWRTDVLPAPVRGLGAAVASWGYRLGMLLAGLLTPVFAVRLGLGWSGTYLIMAAIMLLGPLAAWLAPREPNDITPPRTLLDAIYLPFLNLFEGRKTRLTLWLLVLVITYKLGDAFGSSLLSAFLQRGLGFKPDEVAALRKVVGVIAVFAGMFLGGALMLRLRLFTALWVFGLLQAVTNLLFIALAETHRDFAMLGVAIVAENLATGLGAVAFVAFLTALCDRRFSATQYALLSGLAALPSKLLGPVTGPIADSAGWGPFYAISALVALPGLWLVFALRAPIDHADQR
ncbi:MAG TPA: MFS transporter [Myxococcota bacterium]|nr:MFS transporter [Myxococcota bacterium]